MNSPCFSWLSVPLILALGLSVGPAHAHDLNGSHDHGETQSIPTDGAASSEALETNTKKKRNRKRKRKGPEELPVDDAPSVDATETAKATPEHKDKEQQPVETPTTPAGEETDEEETDEEESNEDEWSPDSMHTMVAPKPDTPEPEVEADPLHFDKIDLSVFDIPIEDTPEVRKWLTWFMGPGHDIYQRWSDRGYRYQPMMKAKLKEAGLPTDLVYLSMIESGYQVKATSRVSAGGLWQFMPATGQRFKLKQDYWVDERYDPEKSLGAAIQYLTILHKKFDSWPLAWAAYNAGEGRIGRACKSANTDSFWDLSRDKRIVAETRRYVPKIMATAILGHYPELYGFRKPKAGPALEYDVSRVEGAVELGVLAKCAGTDVATIKALNPALRRYATPPTSYDVRLPVGTQKAFETALAKIPPSKRITFTRHRVRRGETLGRIAKQYDTDVKTLMRANKIRNANRIYPGMKLTIPRTKAAAMALASNSPPTKKSSSTRRTPTTYKVRSGDILSKIAMRHGLTTSQLKSYNGLKSDKILVGQTLRLTKTASSAKPTATVVTTHVVKRGDTLSQIAERYGMSLSAIQKLNGIRSASHIQLGQRIKIKTSSTVWTTYKVRAGDNLGLIANRNGCTVGELKSWNKLNANVIHPGQRLRIRK